MYVHAKPCTSQTLNMEVSIRHSFLVPRGWFQHYGRQDKQRTILCVLEDNKPVYTNMNMVQNREIN